MPKVTEFWSVRIDDIFYDGVRGVMYAKPNRDTVLASLHVPAHVKIPSLRPEKWIRLSAYCPGFTTINDVKVWVDHFISLPDAGKFYTLLMYRKGKEPAESES